MGTAIGAAGRSASLVIRNGRLIDGMGGAPIEGATVIVGGERIVWVGIGAVDVSPGARVIDATGLSILPGLIDAHVHSDHHGAPDGWMWPLFLRFGVTTVRDVGGDPEIILRAREQERRGELRAPRIVAYGPLLDGAPARHGTEWGGSRELTSPEQARAVAEELIDRGVDGLKVYYQLTRELMQPIAEVAAARGIPVTGHVSAVPTREAVALGLRSIEHVSGVRPPLSDDERAALARFLIERGTYLVPTLLIQEQLADSVSAEEASVADYPGLELVPVEQVRRWVERRRDPQGRAAIKGAYNWEIVSTRIAFVHDFHRLGGEVVAGTDTPNPFVIPGLSLHQELERLVAAGLRPMNALMAATSKAAALLNRPDLGVVEEGRLADIVLVQGDPAEEIAATRRIRLVLKGGMVVHESP